MAKAPFERVFSLIDRKKILQKLVKENIKVALKNAKGEIFDFKVQECDGALNLKGQVAPKGLRDYEKITALFLVDKDRYFLTTRIKHKGDHWMILNDAQFFKFNRRNAFRVQIPTSLDFSFYISSIRNIEVNRKVSIIEFSSGGTRIAWQGQNRMADGTVIKGMLQWGKGKFLSVDAVVAHSPAKGIYGLRFINLNSVLMSRLKMLSVEIQQEIHFK